MYYYDEDDIPERSCYPEDYYLPEYDYDDWVIDDAYERWHYEQQEKEQERNNGR